MATLIGAGHIFSTNGATVGIASLSGYISPNMKSLRLRHGAEVEKIKNQAGNTASLIASDEFVECDFDFIPEGTTITNSKLSAGIPGALAGVSISGLPIIAVGPFTDVFNTNAGNTQPWIYQNDGSLELAQDGKMSSSLKLFRYPFITSAAGITT